jgi:hypothetical protein
MNIRSSTIVGNSGSGSPGGTGNTSNNSGTRGTGVCGLAALAGTSALRSTIVAQNSILGPPTIKDVSGAVVSGGFNLIGISDGSTGFTAADQIGSENTPLDPLLGFRSLNGGETETCVPRANSPAIDRGDASGLSVDQRGLARVSDSAVYANPSGGDGSDVGAVEVNPFGGIVDSDADGMPDEFEIFFDVADANADPDGDGDANLTEFLQRTDPRNSSSYDLRITSITRNGADVVVVFRGVAGKTFRLDGKADLRSEWTELPNVQPATPLQNGPAALTDAGAVSELRRFYRVRLVP